MTGVSGKNWQIKAHEDASAAGTLYGGLDAVRQAALDA